MSPDKLVYMANQIATFFKTQSGTDQAARVAAHIGDFWEPRMIAALRAHVAQDASGTEALVLAALDLLPASHAAAS